MRSALVFLLLLTINLISRVFFRLRRDWVGDVPERPFSHLRVVCILNHTSLYEPLLAGFAPIALLWQFARHGVLPVAEKTMRRTIGLFFRFIVRHVVVVTRQRDHTWERLLNKVDDRALVTILPEGRMKRRNGLDSHGRPMTVRGGIADILRAIPDGRMLIVYSGGLHHIQAPGDRLPRLLKTIRVRLEVLDIAGYRRRLEEEMGPENLKAAIIRDLTRRRDAHCPEPLQVEEPPEMRAAG
jgi:hypothetical protein